MAGCNSDYILHDRVTTPEPEDTGDNSGGINFDPPEFPLSFAIDVCYNDLGIDTYIESIQDFCPVNLETDTYEESCGDGEDSFVFITDTLTQRTGLPLSQVADGDFEATVLFYYEDYSDGESLIFDGNPAIGEYGAIFLTFGDNRSELRELLEEYGHPRDFPDDLVSLRCFVRYHDDVAGTDNSEGYSTRLSFTSDDEERLLDFNSYDGNSERNVRMCGHTYEGYFCNTYPEETHDIDLSAYVIKDEAKDSLQTIGFVTNPVPFLPHVTSRIIYYSGE